MSFPEAPSAIMPLMTDSRKEMVQAINLSNPNSNCGLFLVLRSVLEEANIGMPIPSTLEAWDNNMGEFLVLLNAIPIQVRNSLVLGTLAHDFYDRSKRPYSGEYQGVYAIGIAISGRNGRFLTVSELEKLVKSLDLYLDGCTVWGTYQGDVARISRSSKDLAAAQHVTEIDNELRRTKIAGFHAPRFISRKQHATQNIRDLVRWLKKRANRTLDPSGTIQQHESPMYIGCSSLPMNLRTVNHNPKAGSRNTNALLSLTMSCIQHSLGLDPEAVVVPVLPTWTVTQLSVGEQLVTALASSFVTQGGLNICAAGGQSGKADANAQRYVFGETPYFTDNGRATLEDCDAVDEIKDRLTSLQSLFDGTHEAKLAKLEKSAEVFVKTATEYRRRCAEAAARLERYTQLKERMERDLELLINARRVIHRLKTPNPINNGVEVERTPGFSSPPLP